MNDLPNLLKVFARVFLFWLSGCLMLWALLPDWRSVFAGLILGASVSAWNVYILGNRVARFADNLVNRGTKRVGIGFVSRIATVLIAVMIASRFEQFDLLATVCALAFGPLAMFVIAVTRNARP